MNRVFPFSLTFLWECFPKWCLFEPLLFFSIQIFGSLFFVCLSLKNHTLWWKQSFLTVTHLKTGLLLFFTFSSTHSAVRAAAWQQVWSRSVWPTSGLWSDWCAWRRRAEQVFPPVLQPALVTLKGLEGPPRPANPSPAWLTSAQQWAAWPPTVPTLPSCWCNSALRYTMFLISLVFHSYHRFIQISCLI